MRSKEEIWVHRVLQLFCPNHLIEEIEGDLMQRFDRDRSRFGRTVARRKLAWNVVRFFRPGILLRKTHQTIHTKNNMDMIGNYLKVMQRHMFKNKLNTAIHVLGLTTGITFALVTGVYVWSEMRVNSELKDVDRLYIFEFQQSEGNNYPFFAPMPLAKVLGTEYPNLVEDYFRLYDRRVKVSNGDRHVIYQSILGDSTLLTMMGFPVKAGDPATALAEPNSIVITEDVAQQMFGRTDVLGEHLDLTSGTNQKTTFEVKAILPKLVSNSVTDILHMDANVFLPFANAPDFLLPDPDQWNNGNCIAYVKLKPGVSPTEVEELSNKITRERRPADVQGADRFVLRPLSNYYLLFGNASVIKMISIIGGISVFILLLAGINFINLSIAGAAARLKEIGVRKVIGSVRSQIIFQFLSESVSLAIIAGAFAILAYQIGRPFFSETFNTPLLSVVEFPVSFFVYYVLGLISLGLLAGSYPAFRLSSFRSVDSLKGKINTGAGRHAFTRTLLIIQFSVSIIVFVSALVVREQITIFLNSNLGYNQSSVLTIPSAPRIWSVEGVAKMLTAKEQFLSIPEVESMSLSWEVPNGNVSGNTDLYPLGGDREKTLSLPLFTTDEDYDKVFEIKLLDGVFFQDEANPWRPHDVVLSESAARILQVGVGDQLKTPSVDSVTFTVRGIVQDFHYTSMHDPVRPVGFIHPREILAYRFFSIRLQPGNLVEAVAKVEQKWRETFPDDPFEFIFMEDQVAGLYKSEVRLQKATTIGTAIMTVIVVVGLLGMVLIAVTRRWREIAVRKVLGSSVSGIVKLFALEYLWIIGIAFVVATPLSWYAMNRWLQDFAVRSPLHVWIFILPGAALIGLALLIIAVGTRKAATSNPAQALRSE